MFASLFWFQGKNKVWACPNCNKQFCNKNQWHACGFTSTDVFLRGKNPTEINLFRHFFQHLNAAIGSESYNLSPAKTRVGIQRRIVFGAINSLNRNGVRFHLLFRNTKTVDDCPLITRSETCGPYQVVHFHATSVSAMDWNKSSLAACFCESFQAGK